MSVIFHPLRVRAVLPDTAEAVVVSFDVPDELREVFSFTQGQYLTLRKVIEGQDLRRSYSICAGVGDGELRVGVRKVRGGVFSNWINERLVHGDTISVMAPQGRFFVPMEPGSRRHHLGIAGGSGVTPILSTMKTVLAREPLSRFTLIYGNRAAQVDDVQGRVGRPEEPLPDTGLALHHVFSDEHTDAPLNMGVMNRAKIGEFLRSVVPAASIDHAFVCGPFQMNDEAEAALREAGVPQERIHIERFGIAPQAQQVGAVIHEAKPGDAEAARITIIRDGLSREIAFTKDQPSILDAASAAGLEVPFSCTSGVCGTCRAKCISGEVRMERNFALDRSEVANGFVLTCQAHPTTERVTLSFDER